MQHGLLRNHVQQHVHKIFAMDLRKTTREQRNQMTRNASIDKLNADGWKKNGRNALEEKEKNSDKLCKGHFEPAHGLPVAVNAN